MYDLKNDLSRTNNREVDYFYFGLDVNASPWVMETFIVFNRWYKFSRGSVELTLLK